MRPMQVERTCGKIVYLRPRTSEKDDIISSTKKTELVTDEFDIITPNRILKNHLIENVIGELTKGRKIRDKPGLKPTPRAWYERLIKKIY